MKVTEMCSKCLPHHENIIEIDETFSLASPASTTSINLWKVAGVLHSPKGMTVNSKSPACVVNTVFSWDAGSIPTCQYPEARSRELKKRVPASRSRESSIRGRGTWAWTWGGDDNSSCQHLLLAWTPGLCRAKGILWGGCFMGRLSPVSMWWVTLEVHPRSLSSRENRWANSSSSEGSETTSSFSAC